MTRHYVESGERRPDMNMTALIVTGNPAGAIVAASMIVIGCVGIPEARLFFLASGGLVALFGLFLCWKHR